MTKQKLKNIGKLIFKLVVTIAAIYIVVTKIDLQELWMQIKEINLFYLFLAFLVFSISKIFEAFRINNYYRAIDIHLSEWQNIKLYLLGLFYNIFLPGGISGDGYKVYWLNRKKQANLKKTIWATLINRLNGFLGILILLVIIATLITPDYPYKTWVFILAPVLYILFYLMLKLFFRDYISILPKTTFYSVLIQLLLLICVHLLLVGMGTEKHFINYLFIYLASSIAFVIPVTLGGFGSREVVFVFASGYLNIDASAAVAMSLMLYFIRIIVSFIGIYYLMYPDKILYWRTPKIHQKLQATRNYNNY